jgi:hypothetical protein
MHTLALFLQSCIDSGDLSGSFPQVRVRIELFQAEFKGFHFSDLIKIPAYNFACLSSSIKCSNPNVAFENLSTKAETTQDTKLNSSQRVRLLREESDPSKGIAEEKKRSVMATKRRHSLPLL